MPRRVLLTFLADECVDDVNRPSALVAVSEMRSFGVVVVEPDIEVGLQRLDAGVEGLAHLRPDELVEHRAVEPLDKAVGLR
jgi:hypothetical protein